MSAKYVALFVLIQATSLVLSIIGIPVVALCVQLDHWPKWAWLWFNDEDGYGPGHGDKWKEFKWLALRNSVNNLRYVAGVSGVGRPLFWRTWNIRGKDYYVKFGWLANGYPCCSLGSGKW